MRAIHAAHVGTKTRPVVVLTREAVVPYLGNVTVAPITRTKKGLRTEVAVGTVNGLNEEAVISCDNITTIPKAALGRWLGFLLEHQEAELSAAITHAYDLR